MPQRRNVIEEPDESLSPAEREELRTRLDGLAQEVHTGGTEPKTRRRKPVRRSPAEELAGGRPDFTEGRGRGSVVKTVLALLALLALVPAAAAFLYFVWPTPYDYSHSEGSYWRLNRNTGIRETSTPSGWKTDAQLEALRQISLQTLSVSAGDGRFSCLARFKPDGGPIASRKAPSLEVTMTLKLKTPCPRPKDSTADRRLQVRFVDRDGVSVVEQSIPVVDFNASQDGRTLVCEHYFPMAEEDFHRIVSWTAKANWRTMLLRIDGRDVPVTWGLAHEPTPTEIEDMEQTYLARHPKG